MGYQINSTWTKLRANDIEKLNEIIDNEYCIEREIGRKLNIMNAFEKEFNEAISKFNFDIVLSFMHANNWEWALYDGGLHYDVPTKEQIINSIKTNFFKPGLYNIIELGKKNYSTFSGGIVFEIGYDGRLW